MIICTDSLINRMKGKCNKKLCKFLVNKAIPKLNRDSKLALCSRTLPSMLSFHFDISIRQSTLGLSQPFCLLHINGVYEVMQQEQMRNHRSNS